MMRSHHGMKLYLPPIIKLQGEAEAHVYGDVMKELFHPYIAGWAIQNIISSSPLDSLMRPCTTTCPLFLSSPLISSRAVAAAAAAAAAASVLPLCSNGFGDSHGGQCLSSGGVLPSCFSSNVKRRQLIVVLFGCGGRRAARGSLTSPDWGVLPVPFPCERSTPLMTSSPPSPLEPPRWAARGF